MNEIFYMYSTTMMPTLLTILMLYYCLIVKMKLSDRLINNKVFNVIKNTLIIFSVLIAILLTLIIAFVTFGAMLIVTMFIVDFDYNFLYKIATTFYILMIFFSSNQDNKKEFNYSLFLLMSLYVIWYL